jgi:hypothetical protein
LVQYNNDVNMHVLKIQLRGKIQIRGKWVVFVFFRLDFIDHSDWPASGELVTAYKSCIRAQLEHKKEPLTESTVPWRKSAGNSSFNLDHGSSAGFWFPAEDHAALSLLQLLLSEGGCAHVRSVYEHLLWAFWSET